MSTFVQLRVVARKDEAKVGEYVKYPGSYEGEHVPKGQLWLWDCLWNSKDESTGGQLLGPEETWTCTRMTVCTRNWHWPQQLTYPGASVWGYWEPGTATERLSPADRGIHPVHILVLCIFSLVAFILLSQKGEQDEVFDAVCVRVSAVCLHYLCGQRCTYVVHMCALYAPPIWTTSPLLLLDLGTRSCSSLTPLRLSDPAQYIFL